MVLIEYKSKSAPVTYDRGKVVESEKDNLVHTCTVLYELVKPVTPRNRYIIKVVSKEVQISVKKTCFVSSSGGTILNCYLLIYSSVIFLEHVWGVYLRVFWSRCVA